MLCHSTWASGLPLVAAASSISVLPGSATAAHIDPHFQGQESQPVLVLGEMELHHSRFEEQRPPQLWKLLLFPAPCPLITSLSPFMLALLRGVHPSLAISRQQNHDLWLNTAFLKSLTIFIPIFPGIFFHAALSGSSSTGKQDTKDLV